MINQILSIFDEAVADKCYIGNYARLAIRGRQSVDGKAKIFPVSCTLGENCEDLSEFVDNLIPDDTKAGVAFWKIVKNIEYTPVKGISLSRGIRHASAVVEFVSWVNLRMATGDSTHASWCSDPGKIILDAVRTFDCKRGRIETGLDYIKNLKIEVVQIGNADTWRRAMSEYSIDNLEALTIWPYTGFTLQVRIDFNISSKCIPAFECYTCAEVTAVASIDLDNICTGGTIELSAVIDGSTANLLQWQELIDEVWTDIEDGTVTPFTIEDLEGDDSVVHSYRLQVRTCSECTVLSNTVTVTMNDHPEVYVSTFDDVIPLIGATIITSEVVGGLGGNTYQWQRQIAGIWTNIAGANNNEYALSGATFGAGTHRFRVVVNQDVNCTGTSDSIVITVTASGPM